VSVALRERRREWAAAARIQAAGLTTDEYRAACFTACVCWTNHRPWCWLPTRVRNEAFVLFGRRYTARLVAHWKEDGGV
jgi:hypothetical protein